MNYQRKRVAKRLASGLLAGALALGGLAISGGTASAVTPTVNRVAGVDRYATSVALADAYKSGGAEHVLIVSGENYPDALTASGYAGSLANDAVILLTRAAALPDTVALWLSNTSNLAAGAKVYIVGGTSSVSADVATQVTAITGITPTRISGDDRYATAVALSKATAITDQFIVVSGASFADGVSAAAWAFEATTPVLLAGPNGLDAATKAEVKRITTATAGAKAFIVGGTSAVSAAVESELVDQGVKYSNIKRLAGADRYATSSAVNTFLATAANTREAFDGSKIALVTGENFADAIASAPYLGGTQRHAVLMPASGIPASVAALAGALAPSKPTSVVAIGGTAAVANETVGALQAAVSGLGAVTPVWTVAEGATTATMTFTLPAATAITTAAENCVAANACAVADSVGKWLKDKGNYSINGIKLASFGTGSVAVTTAGANAGDKPVVTLTLPTGFTGAGVTVSFAGIGEAKAADNTSYSIAAASATIADDATAPTVSAVNIAANAAGTAYLQVSEVATADITKITVATSAGAAKCNGTAAAAPSFVPATGLYTCSGTPAVALAAGDVITFAADALTDTAGNKSAATTFTIGAADATAPTLTRTSVTTSNSAAGSTKSEFALSGTSPIILESVATGSLNGQGGLGWRVVISSSTGNIPSFEVDSATKRITMTVNLAKHDRADIAAAISNNPAVAALLAVKTGGASTDKLSPTYLSGDMAVTTSGLSVTTIVFTASEVLSAADGTKFSATGCAVTNANQAVVTAGTTVTVTCNASATPFSGLVALAGSAVTDLRANNSVATATGAGL